MCGICGVINRDKQPVAESVLQAMTNRLAHRGPDERGIAFPTSWVGLGHSRLKVIDLTDAARQPMASQDSFTWIVYNGELYNYRSLRTELESHGRRFLSQSDTEVILQAYEQWPADCVERFDGMFAFAIVDCPRQKLLLARDRTGKKPLFYSSDQNRWAFASEIKALLVHPEIPCQFRESVLPFYLAYGYVPTPNTFYTHIQSLAPASVLTVELLSGKAAIRRYWRLNIPTRTAVGSRQQTIRTLRQHLTEAVRKRLVSDVPLGGFLSGGIDSSIIVGLMSRLIPEAVHTFTIGFGGDPRYDETAYARLVAERFHTKHTEFIVQPKAFNWIERLVYHHDQPFGDASAIPTFFLCALAKEHVTVALNGDGGDEVFAGYRRFIAASISQRLPHWLVEGMAGILNQAHVQRWSQRCWLGELQRFLDAARKPWDERLARWVSYFPNPIGLLRPEWRNLGEESWLAPVRRWLSEVPMASALSQSLYVNFHEYLPNDLHVKMDRCSMAHGLETRSPFLDIALIEFAASLPDSYKLRGMRTKVLLKEAFADLLPPRIQRRGKWGFGVPLDAWFRTELRPAVFEVLLNPKARWRSYLDSQAVEQLCRAHLQKECNRGLQLWNLATLEIWLQMTARGVWQNPNLDEHCSSGSEVLAGSITDQRKQ